jgi:hypothetical protein
MGCAETRNRPEKGLADDTTAATSRPSRRSSAAALDGPGGNVGVVWHF